MRNSRDTESHVSNDADEVAKQVAEKAYRNFTYACGWPRKKESRDDQAKEMAGGLDEDAQVKAFTAYLKDNVENRRSWTARQGKITKWSRADAFFTFTYGHHIAVRTAMILGPTFLGILAMIIILSLNSQENASEVVREWSLPLGSLLVSLIAIMLSSSAAMRQYFRDFRANYIDAVNAGHRLTEKSKQDSNNETNVEQIPVPLPLTAPTGKSNRTSKAAVTAVVLVGVGFVLGSLGR